MVLGRDNKKNSYLRISIGKIRHVYLQVTSTSILITCLLMERVQVSWYPTRIYPLLIVRKKCPNSFNKMPAFAFRPSFCWGVCEHEVWWNIPLNCMNCWNWSDEYSQALLLEKAHMDIPNCILISFKNVWNTENTWYRFLVNQIRVHLKNNHKK